VDLESELGGSCSSGSTRHRNLFRSSASRSGGFSDRRRGCL